MSDVETCECRTMAIGRCNQCQSPICMHHSRLLDGICLCLAHYEDAKGTAVPQGGTTEAQRPVPDFAPSEVAQRRRRPWGRRP